MRLKKELEPLLKIDAVLSLFPVSRSSWYTGIKSGIYPKPVKLGPRSVASLGYRPTSLGAPT